jgi:hypothetical protein
MVYSMQQQSLDTQLLNDAYSVGDEEGGRAVNELSPLVRKV